MFSTVSSGQSTARVHSLVVKRSGCHKGAPIGWGETVLWSSLDVCIDAEIGACNDEYRRQQKQQLQQQHPCASPPNPFRQSALAILDVNFDTANMGKYANAPVIRRLVAGGIVTAAAVEEAEEGRDVNPTANDNASITYAWLTGPLHVLRIEGNKYDDSADFGPVIPADEEDAEDRDSAAADAVTMTLEHLTEISLRRCGLSSILGLRGRCALLTKLNLTDCTALTSLEGIEGHRLLEEVVATGTRISDLQPLLRCRNLKKVVVASCRQLVSLDGIEGHQWLEEVDASRTTIPSVAPLRTCPALTSVNLSHCRNLASLDGLTGSGGDNGDGVGSGDGGGGAAITSLDLSFTDFGAATFSTLDRFRFLKKIVLRSCFSLTSLDALQNHTMLEEIDVSATSITRLTTTTTGTTRTADAEGSSLPLLFSSALHGCRNTLVRLILRNCDQLTSLEGLEEHARLELLDLSGTAVSSLRPLQGCLTIRKVDIRRCQHLLPYYYTATSGTAASDVEGDLPPGVEVQTSGSV